MDSIDNQPRDEIARVVIADDKSLPAASRDKLNKGLTAICNANISKTLTAIFSQAEITADAVRFIQRGTVYLAEIPRKLQKDFSEGSLKFLEKSTGELVGEIVSSNNFGNKGHVIIKEAGILQSNIPHDLTMIAMQQQLAQMVAVLDEVRSRVIELQKTYDESLLGELRGMRDQLSQVQNVDDLESQRDLIKDAITHLNLTRGKITQRLLAEMQKMPEVPESAWKRFFITLTKEGFRDKVITGYEKVQELFSYYLAATEILAFAYALLGEQRAYTDIFTPDTELLKDERLTNLKRSEVFVGICDERWYNAPERYLGRIRLKAQKVFLTGPDSIQIEVTGEQILEAIGNVRSAEETEQC